MTIIVTERNRLYILATITGRFKSFISQFLNREILNCRFRNNLV